MISVYEITFPSGNTYVGCSSQPKQRFKEHQKRPTNRLISNEFDKYDCDEVNLQIVSKYSDREKAEGREMELIEYYSKFGKSLNYIGNDEITYEEYKELDPLDKEYVRLVVDLNERLKNDFKERVQSEGRTMSWVIERFVKEYTYDREPVDNR